MKLSVFLVVTAVAVTGLAAVQHLEREMPMTPTSYVAMGELRLTIPEAKKQKFISAVRKFADENGFQLRGDLSDLPFRDGWQITYMEYGRSDGSEIRIACIFKPGEFMVGFYDPLNSGTWRDLKEKFSTAVQDLAAPNGQ